VTVDFALFFSPEGLALAHRQAAGHWALVGEASLEGDLDAAMADLKSAAEARGLGKGGVLLVLPDDQVLYISFMAPADNADLVVERITEGLEGMTPYAVAELTYDWRAVEVDRVKVAVIAQETLAEATQFAKAHGFKPAGFAAMPPAERFPGIALFGDKRPELPEAAMGMAFGADDWAKHAEAAKTVEEAPDAKDGEADPVVAEPEDTKATAEAEVEAGGEPDGARTDAKSEAKADAGEPVPDTDPAATEDAVPPATEAATDDAAPPSPITDPTLNQTIAPIPPEDEDATKAEVKASDTPEPEEETPEAAPAEDVTAPTAAKTEAESPAPAAEEGDVPDETAKASPEDASEASVEPRPAAPPRSKAQKPAAGSKSLTAEKPEGPAARPARFSPVASPRDDAEPEEATDSDTAAGDAPMLSFGAQRGKVPKPTGDAGQSVSTRQGRLGFGAATPRGEPVLHPDAAPTSKGDSAASVPPAAKPSSRLAAQLARVRDASKSRPSPEPAAPSEAIVDDRTLGGGATSAQVGALAARDMAGEEAAGTADSGDGARAGLFRRRGNADKTAVPAPTASGDGTATAESAFASGLLARKPVQASGPSFKTGLILTLILLVLLALIAIWSVLFLPDSPMARLFTGDRGSESAAVSVEDPLDAPEPPAAISAPPAMGLRDTGTAALPDADVADADEVAALAPGPEVVPPLSDPDPAAAISDAAPPAEPEALPEADAAAALPDIDAEIELPPLPPLPEEALPSLEETEAIYAADGIWPRTPERPFFEPFTITDDIYVASIDPAVSAFDAVALPPAGVNPGELLRRVPPPPPFGTEIERDARGLVTPTPEGVLTPEGAFVVLGTPPVAAVPRPREVEPAVEAAPALDVEDAILGTFQPTPRPGDLEETRERQVLGGLTVTELAGLRPAERPLSAQEAAARASLFPGDEAETETETADVATPAAPAADISGTRLAVAESLLPRSRPGNIETIVASAQRAPAPVVEARAVAPAPSIPSNADVTRAATERNAIRLRDVNLIGVTGTTSNRRALVRLPSGRFVRVGVGDRLDGGRVAAIGEASLQYVRNGRNITLEIPG
jgi:hypothetical protein